MNKESIRDLVNDLMMLRFILSSQIGILDLSSIDTRPLKNTTTVRVIGELEFIYDTLGLKIGLLRDSIPQPEGEKSE